MDKDRVIAFIGIIASALIMIAVIGMLISAAFAATLKWSAPTVYTDNTRITDGARAKIVYEVYTRTPSGQWTSVGTTDAGATSATAPDPAPGNTLYYTVDATLYGMRGEKGAAVSKTVPLQTPGAPTAITVE